jgi:uncharacterized phage infection (PIP) family protein YhgE
MGSAFKDGVDAGLSDFKSYNSSLGGVSLGTDPSDFSNVASIAGRAPDFISRMRSGFERIGENLHDDPKSWADTQKQHLLSGCAGMLTQSENVTTRANEARDVADQAKTLRDAGDEEKKSELDEAEQRLKEASDTLREQIDVVRGGLNEFYDMLRDVNAQFKNAIALAKNGVDGSGSQVEQVLSDIRSLEDQASGKIAEEKNLFAQRDAQTRAYADLTAKIDEKVRIEQDADRALAEGAKKDPPLSPGDLRSLEQTSATARQERERAEADRSTYWLQTLRPSEEAYWAKVGESAPLKQQLSALKQRRDTLMDGLNKSRTAFAELNVEYQEPNL